MRQKEQKCLGSAILSAERYIGDGPFAVLLGDTITKSSSPATRQLINLHGKFQKPVISLKTIPESKFNKYGVVKADEIEPNIYRINQLVEKPNANDDYSNLAIVGRYVLTSDIFDMICETEADANGEIQLTDALSKLDEVYGVLFEGKTFNISNRFDWLKASIEFGLDSSDRDELIEYMKTFI